MWPWLLYPHRPYDHTALEPHTWLLVIWGRQRAITALNQTGTTSSGRSDATYISSWATSHPGKSSSWNQSFPHFQRSLQSSRSPLPCSPGLSHLGRWRTRGIEFLIFLRHSKSDIFCGSSTIEVYFSYKKQKQVFLSSWNLASKMIQRRWLLCLEGLCLSAQAWQRRLAPLHQASSRSAQSTPELGETGVQGARSLPLLPVARTCVGGHSKPRGRLGDVVQLCAQEEEELGPEDVFLGRRER